MNPRVLLVEDSAMVSGALKMLLDARGFDATVAETAAAAIDWPHAEPADVLLLDLTLPDADGLTVISGLAARGLRPASIFAMTGHGDAATRERCLAAGCDDVLLKPVPVQQLLQIVSAAVA